MCVQTRAVHRLAILALGSLFLLPSGKALAAGKPKTPPSAPVPVEAEQPQLLTPGYRVKTSDVTLPDGVLPGSYIRTIRPFSNWTLICDTNLQSKKKVCNISQTILGPSGDTVFSWSMAATLEGRPFLILRTPLETDQEAGIQLDLEAGRAPLMVSFRGCDQNVCIAYLMLEQQLRTAIETGAVITITYITRIDQGRHKLSFRVPLAGLTKALAAI